MSAEPSASRVSVAGRAGQSLFAEDFPAGRLDAAKWTTESGNAARLGRTQLRDWIHPGAAEFRVGPDGAELALDTFNPAERRFLGTHAKSLERFQPGDAGVELSARIRVGELQPGIVYALYLYGCEGNCLRHHDEVDIELTTSTIGGARPSVQLNWYANESSDGGHGALVALPAGFDALAEHEWTIRWSRSRIAFLVDGNVLDASAKNIPRGPMHADVIAWAPASTWSAAFSPTLQLARTATQNRHYSAWVRSLVVRSY